MDATQLEPFVDPLLLPQPLRSTERAANKEHSVKDALIYRIAMRETLCKLHRDLPPTHLWTYGDGPIGPLIEAHKDQGILVEWKNDLPPRHFLPIDYSLHGSGRTVPESRAVVHLHGGRTPAASDGYPESWYPTGHSRTYFYPNQQDATMLWYHDHAMGVNRLNLYAGLMGVYLLRDDFEAGLNLPHGDHELPLMLSDRLFDPHGQLFYPVSENLASPWVDDFSGDAMLVNGRVQPFHNVEPAKYRLRIVNAANSRFFRLSLSNDGIFYQIGSDQGLLPQPVALKNLLLAPGERVDLIVDFTHSAGERIILKNGGFSMMQFRVGNRPVGARVTDNSILPTQLSPVDRLAESDAIRTRELTLNEFDDPSGRPMVMLLNRTPWHMPITETVKLDTTEIWSLVNLNDETHPIHLHHIRFQVLDRRAFDRDSYLLDNAKLKYIGPALIPNPEELGWKDVVHCPPGLITRIIIHFTGYPGRYIWHCHIQEHEANDMMRPYEIVY
jgi:spore coat protein A